MQKAAGLGARHCPGLSDKIGRRGPVHRRHEPGAAISEELIRRIRKSSDREVEGVQIAGETIARLRKMAQGVLIQTLGWEHRLPAILDVAGI